MLLIAQSHPGFQMTSKRTCSRPKNWPKTSINHFVVRAGQYMNAKSKSATADVIEKKPILLNIKNSLFLMRLDI